MEKPNPYIPKHLRFRQRPIEERERLEQQMGTLGMEQLVSILFLLFNLVDGHKYDKNNKFLFTLQKNHSEFVFKEFRSQAIAIPL